jgi:hypothetical protein
MFLPSAVQYSGLSLHGFEHAPVAGVIPNGQVDVQVSGRGLAYAGDNCAPTLGCDSFGHVQSLRKDDIDAGGNEEIDREDYRD